MKTRKAFFILFVFTISQSIFAQFGKIVDIDGYVNVREQANTKSKIIGTIDSGEIIFAFFNDVELGSNWVIVDYTNNTGKTISGYVHNSRIKRINSYKKMPKLISDTSRVQFLYKNISIRIESEKFDFEKHKNKFPKNDNGDYVVKDTFNGQNMWGVYGKTPKNHYKSICISIGNKKVHIPKKDFENLFNINNESVSCYNDEAKNNTYIILQNGDGAEAYTVLFKIEKNKYVERKIMTPF